MLLRVLPLIILLMLPALPAAAVEDIAATMQKLEVQRMGEPDVPAQELQAPATPDEMREAMAMDSKGVLHASVTPQKTLQAGKPVTLVLHLKDKQNKPISLAGLEERHTKKIHLLVVDQSLSDYHHLHPVALKKAGSYEFTFTPKTSHNYRVFADVKPVKGDAEMVPVLLSGKSPCGKPCIEKKDADASEVGGVKAAVTFDQKTFKVGSATHGEITLTDDKGDKLTDLQPVMGAYGHIVGFYDDFATTAHMHPLGAEPKKPADRGASPLTFMLHPMRAGYMKYFVQIRRGDRDIFLPFGLTVED